MYPGATGKLTVVQPELAPIGGRLDQFTGEFRPVLQTTLYDDIDVRFEKRICRVGLRQSYPRFTARTDRDIDPDVSILGNALPRYRLDIGKRNFHASITILPRVELGHVGAFD